jgi:hypothetical protein
MKTQNKSNVLWSFTAFLLMLIAYDAWACQDRKNRRTISQMMTRASEKYLIIPVIWGVLTGHFFFSQHHLKDPEDR